ncbi:hypothetical protein AB4Z46_28455 [Variovorax sp. M-6]|uniref:hypothetical protein n=1 Tax=Variovorax sp. M-6 TaxID=3233041 RepID=UPI003F96D8FF
MRLFVVIVLVSLAASAAMSALDQVLPPARVDDASSIAEFASYQGSVAAFAAD